MLISYSFSLPWCFTTETSKKKQELGRARRKLGHGGTWRAWQGGRGSWQREKSTPRTLLVPAVHLEGASVSPVLYITYTNDCLMPLILVSLMSPP